MNFKDKLLVAGCVVAIAALMNMIAATYNPSGYWHFWGEVHDVLAWLFWLVLILATLFVLIRLNQARKVQLVKEGTKAVILHGKEGPRVERLDTGLESLQLLQALRQSMQANSTAAAMVQRWSKIAEEPNTVTVEGKTNVPELPAPHANTDECLLISSTVQPHADRILSGRGLLIGISGSGKSNSTACFAEELGRLDVPFVLADTENEYQSLCNPRWLPHGALAGLSGGEYAVTAENAQRFGAYLLEQNLQVILNLQSYESFEEAAQVMVNLIDGLREWEEARANEIRIPCEFMLEEAVTWLPQNIRESPLYGTEVMNKLQSAFFNDMVRKGRKRGLGLAVICQKIAEIDKRALQSTWKLLHRQTEHPDLKHYENLGITREETLSLKNGEAFYFDSQMSKVRLQMRERYSPHGADTPGLKSLKQHQLLSRNTVESGGNYAEFGRNNGVNSVKQPNSNEIFDQPGKPFQNISPFRQTAKLPEKDALKGIPENIIRDIERLYEAKGCKNRVSIRDELNLNGDQYWMVRAVCDAYDARMQMASGGE